MCVIDDKFGVFLVYFSQNIKKADLSLLNLGLGRNEY